MKSNEKQFWFPTKTYGWGWGPPNCWQGWVVLAVYAVLVCGGAFLVPEDVILFVAYAVFLTIVLTVVCWIKGEKPRWRWGKE